MLKASTAKPEEWVCWQIELSAVGAPQACAQAKRTPVIRDGNDENALHGSRI
jgi:hypothetical protein